MKIEVGIKFIEVVLFGVKSSSFVKFLKKIVNIELVTFQRNDYCTI